MFRRAALSVALVLAAALPAGVAAATSARPQVAGSALGDTTISVNNLRDGWDQAEPELSPAIVGGSDFGQLFSTKVQGQVYAAPLVVNRTATSPGTLIAATEDDNVYGMNPIDGGIAWSTNLGTPWSATVLGCGDLTPNLGITSTPVYDPSTDTVYVMAKDAPHGATSDDPRFELHALDAETGFERPGWPVTIGGHPNNDPTRTFNPETAAQRPGLLLLNGVIYAGFASHCDDGPYVGYVVGVSTTTATQTAMFSMEAGTSNGEAGIWQSGGGLVSDGSNQIIVATGNGFTAPVAPSDAPPKDLSEAVVRLAVKANGTLKATDWFSPANGDSLNQTDSDLGSGGPMAIPAGYGTASYPDLLVEAGKDGRLFLLDRDELGGEAQGPGGTDNVLDTVQLANGVWGHPAFWGGTPGTDSAGGYVYLLPSYGSHLQALKLGHNGKGVPQLVSTANSVNTFGYTSGSPIVTSDGTSDGSALVWVVGVHDSTGSAPMLYAFNATPDNGILDLVYSAPLDPPGVSNENAHGAKFTTVATDNGRVFVGTRDGYVFGFGHPSNAPIYAPHTDLGSVPVGTISAPVAVTLTASRTVQVTGVTTKAPFQVVDSSPALPVTLDPAGVAGPTTMTVDLTMTPTTAGDQSNTLSVATVDPATTAAGSVDFGLSGYGTSPGLAAFPPAVNFGTIPIPGHDSQGIELVNTAGVDETISSVTPLPAPFSSSDLPSVGQVVPAGTTLAVPLVYAPTNASTNDATTLSIGVDGDAEIVSIPLSGGAVQGSPKLVRKPKTLNFGPVARGTSRTMTFQLYNAGDVLLKIDKAKAPFGAFTAKLPVSEGATIQPDQSIIQSVTFKPTKKGTVTATYEVTGNDTAGAQFEKLIGLDDQLADRYNHSKTLRTQLGAPTDATTKVGPGYERLFTHGDMFWSTKGGVRALTGPILAKYLALHGPKSTVGYPATGVAPLAPRGKYVRFLSGERIYWSAHTGAWSIHGRTAHKWLELGAQRSSLGLPITDPRTIKGGTTQTYENGSITWTKHHGYVVKLRH